MRETVSRSVRIVGENSIFRDTVELYFSCVSQLVYVMNEEWDILKPLSALDRVNCCRNLVHRTKDNPNPKYDFFDKTYPLMPIYLRGAAIKAAISIITMHRANLEIWERSDKTASKPHLSVTHHKMPCFYKDGCFELLEDDKCKIKLLINDQWQYVTVQLNHSDMRNLKSRFDITTASNPTLEKHGTRYSLSFSFSRQSKFDKKETLGNIVCGVDLGINHAAVCAVIDGNGNVLARKFIDFPIEEARMKHTCNLIRNANRHGVFAPKKLIRFRQNYNKSISKMTALAVVSFAKEHGADIIACENLSRRIGKSRKSQGERLGLWKKKSILQMIERAAHWNSIRFASVYQSGTSYYAFDGSGPVSRFPKNKSVCRFQSGKIYASDLSAAYNIGARFYINELKLKLSDGSLALSKRTEVFLSGIRISKCTLSTLWRLSELMQKDSPHYPVCEDGHQTPELSSGWTEEVQFLSPKGRISEGQEPEGRRENSPA